MQPSSGSWACSAAMRTSYISARLMVWCPGQCPVARTGLVSMADLRMTIAHAALETKGSVE